MTKKEIRTADTQGIQERRSQPPYSLNREIADAATKLGTTITGEYAVRTANAVRHFINNYHRVVFPLIEELKMTYPRAKTGAGRTHIQQVRASLMHDIMLKVYALDETGIFPMIFSPASNSGSIVHEGDLIICYRGLEGVRTMGSESGQTMPMSVYLGRISDKNYHNAGWNLKTVQVGTLDYGQTDLTAPSAARSELADIFVGNDENALQQLPIMV